MKGSVGVGFTIDRGRASAAAAVRKSLSILSRNKLISLALAGIIGASLCGFVSVAQAGEVNATANIYSALRSYVQQIDPQESRSASVRQPGNDDAFAALRDYAQQLPPSPSISPKPDAIKVADADNAVDALKQFFQQLNNPSKPAEKPVAPKSAPVKPQEPLVQASYVGTKVCLGCHTSQATTFEHTLMGRLLKQGKLQCESCHGPGSEHVRLGGGVGVGGIISFRPNDTNRTAEQDNAICLGCHERGERTLWQGSVHQERGLFCTNCHTIMKAVSRKNQLKTAWQPDTCFQCHKDRRAQMFESAHMPMRPDESKVVCSDCHNPHGSFTDALLRGDSINDTCYKCHAEKRGPFLFEHEPVRENCLNCHDPHGSIHQYMLKLARPRLCTECHSLMNVTAGATNHFALGQACEECHVAIHGSNSPGGALFFR